MTKKDYIKFAVMLRTMKPNTPRIGQLALLPPENYAFWCSVVQNTADLFTEDNPRFDRDRFLIACELKDAPIVLRRKRKGRS